MLARMGGFRGRWAVARLVAMVLVAVAVALAVLIVASPGVVAASPPSSPPATAGVAAGLQPAESEQGAGVDIDRANETGDEAAAVDEADAEAEPSPSPTPSAGATVDEVDDTADPADEETSDPTTVPAPTPEPTPVLEASPEPIPTPEPEPTPTVDPDATGTQPSEPTIDCEIVPTPDAADHTPEAAPAEVENVVTGGADPRDSAGTMEPVSPTESVRRHSIEAGPSPDPRSWVPTPQARRVEVVVVTRVELQVKVQDRPAPGRRLRLVDEPSFDLQPRSEAPTQVVDPLMTTGAGVVLVAPRVPTMVTVATEFARAGSGWAGPLVFASWLRRQLRERRLSQRQLAERSGISHSTISRVISGTRSPSLETATKLVRALRHGWTEDQVATYFDLLPERTILPAQRVEAALRGDSELSESDVRSVMVEYLAVRSHRLRSIHIVPDENGAVDGSEVTDDGERRARRKPLRSLPRSRRGASG